MKNFKTFIALTIMVMFVMSSCGKEQILQEEAALKSGDNAIPELIVEDNNHGLADWEEMITTAKERNEKMELNSSGANYKMMCDCALIRDEADTGYSPGSVSTLDIVILQKMILNYDFNGDGCIEFLNPKGGLSQDAMGWINAGNPPATTDFNQDGDLTGFGDASFAFGLANKLGAITGDSALCFDDLECIRDYILGRIDC